MAAQLVPPNLDQMDDGAAMDDDEMMTGGDEIDGDTGEEFPAIEREIEAYVPEWQPPLVAIVGRPNVGKSTLFNRMVGERAAITFDTPGVTRDRQEAIARLGPHECVLIDTGGFEPSEREGMLPLMRRQAEVAINQADAIVFMTCAREGLLPADEEIALVLRRTKKPVFLVANKVDAPSLENDAMAMYALGFDNVIPIAAEHGRGMLDLTEALVEALQESGCWEGEPDHDTIVEREKVRGGVVERVRVCFVGKPNVGKSTLVNKLLGNERVITADMPGTTRDSIDIPFTYQGEPFVLVDTAGLRRKRAVHDPVEQYSVSRTVRAIERSHVAVLLLDATQPLADQDSKIAALIQDRGRACVIAINKWDAVEGKDGKSVLAFQADLERVMPFVAHCPKVFISAKTGQRVEKLFDVAREAFTAFNRRIPTHKFNKFLVALQQRLQPPTYRGRSLKMSYGAQLSVRPPRFVILVNLLGACSPAYERFVISRIREEWDFMGSPVRLEMRKKPERKKRKLSDAQVAALAATQPGDEEAWLEVLAHAPAGVLDDDDDMSDDWDEEDDAAEFARQHAHGDDDDDFG